MHETAGSSRERNAAATRRLILDQARRQFASLGYRATTVKGVADAAGVSPNLITRYFGGKEGLFLAAAQVEIAIDPVFTGELAAFGDRLAASIVDRWSGQQGEDPLLVLQRAAGERPEAAEALASFLDANSLEPLRRYLLASGLAAAEAEARAAAIDAFVLGVSTRRRVLRSDLGDAGQLREWLAAAIQRLADDRSRREGTAPCLPAGDHEQDVRHGQADQGEQDPSSPPREEVARVDRRPAGIAARLRHVLRLHHADNPDRHSGYHAPSWSRWPDGLTA